MSTEAKRRQELEGAGSTSTGMREAEEEAEEGGFRPKRPKRFGGGDDDDEADEFELEEEVEASSPSFALVRSLSSVADTMASSSRDRSAARGVEGPRERSGSATGIGERRRVCLRLVGVGVGIKAEAIAGERCFSVVLLQSSSPTAAWRRTYDIGSKNRIEKEGQGTERETEGEREKEDGKL